MFVKYCIGAGLGMLAGIMCGARLPFCFAFFGCGDIFGVAMIVCFGVAIMEVILRVMGCD
jgi:hypothetical protein